MRRIEGEAVYNGEIVTLYEIWGDDVTIIRYEHGPLVVKVKDLDCINTSFDIANYLLNMTEED